MAQPDERMIKWLRDTHAMEKEAESMLTTMASRIEHYPELKQRVEQHIEETRSQASRVEARLQALGSDTTTVKDASSSAMGAVAAGSHAFWSDEVLKGFGASYAFEHLEIAAYRNLMFAAEALGDTATAQLCREILPEEEAMAGWLLEHQQALVQQFIALDQAEGVSAKR